MAEKTRPNGYGERNQGKKPTTKPAGVPVENDGELDDQPSLPSAQSLAEKLMAREDSRRTVNFGKYELPRREPAAPAAPSASAEIGRPAESRMAFDFAAAPTKREEPSEQEFDFGGETPRRRGRPARRPEPPSREPEPPERDFSFEQPPAPPPAREGHRKPEPEATRPEEQPARRRTPVDQTPVREFAFEELNGEPSPPKRQRPAAPPQPREPAPPIMRAVIEPEPGTPPWAAPEQEAAQPVAERDEFLKRISQQFEQEFSEKFSRGGPAAGRPATEPEPRPVPERMPSRPEDPAPRRFENPAAPKPREPAPEDNIAEDFISRFREDVSEEEAKISEDFKETLAEKFMRERERYLKELGIAEKIEQEKSEPQTGPAQSPRRRLDFQILPELHMERSDEPPSRMHPNPAVPITYTRAGVPQPQRLPDEYDEGDDEPFPNSAPDAVFDQYTASGGKKSSEQLLLELGARSRMREVHAAFNQPQKAQMQPGQFQFQFETPEEQEKKRALAAKKNVTGWPRRVVALSAAAGIVAIALIAWVLVTYLNLTDRLRPESAPEPAASASQNALSSLELFESRIFEQRGSLGNVFIKKSGVTVKNADVSGYVLIEGIDSAGTVRLEDMSIDGAVSLSDTAVDTLELHNVKAGRVIINTDKAAVTVRASGSTDVPVLELRTNSHVAGEIDPQAPGIRGLLVRPREPGRNIEAELSNMLLQTVETISDGAEATLRFSGTTAESFSADGSLSILGDGRVSSLVIGKKTGQGAGDFEDSGLVSLLVKGVGVGSISVRSPAALNLGAPVDQVFTASPLSMGGDGSVVSLTINPQFGSGRLLVDIAGLTLQEVYVNAEARINSTGSSRINTITANESTYALGNKVNLLKVNANGVIYENEPDKIQTASGVRPPQTKADNPNLDYDLGPSGAETDFSADDLATTCGHPRQSGGFIVGDGSADAPFEVSNPLQLAHVTLHPGSRFVQTADIDISSESAYAGGFAVICPDNAFTGVFDGRGFGILNLRIMSAGENVGLFSKNKGTIRSVNIVSGDISSSGTGSYVGGIAGYSYEGGVIQSCSNGARVSGGENSGVGGIAGFNSDSAKIRDCYNFARISGGDFSGGVVGMNGQSASITGCYNAGRIDGQNITGAVAGENSGGVIANCYYLEQTAGSGIGSGGGTAYERTAGELSDAQMVAELTAGNEGSLWTSGESSGNYHYPVLKKPE